MYRILEQEGMNRERRAVATHPPRKVPELIATKVNDVWSWDITKMRGEAKGIWYHAYVVLDIFSRYIVAWRIEKIEDGYLARDMIADAIVEQGVAPGYVHADGGAAMTSKPLASLLVDLDVRRSHNRPHITQTPAPVDLAALRHERGLTLTDVAHVLGTWPARISDIEKHRRPLPALRQRYETWLTTTQPLKNVA